jgi:hypothetical protein
LLSAVRVAYGLRTRWSGFRIPAGIGYFSPLRNVQTGSGVKSSFLFSGYRSFFPGVRRPEREADHSYSSVKVKSTYILCSWRGHSLFLLDKVPAASAFRVLSLRMKHHVCQSRRYLFTTLHGVTHQSAVIDAVSVAGSVLCSSHLLVL